MVYVSILKTLKESGQVFSCGNGGSMCDAMHFAEELTGRYDKHRKALPAIAISDPSHITCTANDYGFEYIFSRYIEALGKEGDVLLAISTSGNSQNIINAIEDARTKGIITIALTGNDGGKAGQLADVEIRVPYTGYSAHSQEMHIIIIHCMIEYIENLHLALNSK